MASQPTGNTYRIQTIGDLLMVPADRLHDCLRDIEYGINLIVLVHGDDAKPDLLPYVDWTDDGSRNVDLRTDEGEAFLTLRVTDKEPAE